MNRSQTLLLEAREEIEPRTWSRPGYVISTCSIRLDLEFVHREISRSYWAEGISRKVLERALANSVVFGVYRDDGVQVGFARLVTDAATFAYLCDVVITESERGNGLGAWLSDCVVNHPVLQGLRRWVLATRNAHSLYEKAGWTPLANPGAFMERYFPDVYRIADSSSRAPLGGDRA